MQESFSNSASRHLQDAKVLLAQKRWDNAVYLAGYVIECSFKVIVELYFQPGGSAVKKFSHDLTKLEGEAMERLRVLYPILDQQLPASRLGGTVLAQNHPERRYFKSPLWSENDAESAIDRAEKIYQETIIKLILDGLVPSHDALEQ